MNIGQNNQRSRRPFPLQLALAAILVISANLISVQDLQSKVGLEKDGWLSADYTFQQNPSMNIGGRGNAQFEIADQNTLLNADQIIYERDRGIINAQGHVRILRKGMLTLGSAYKFKINSPQYLVTEENATVGVLHLRHRGSNSFLPPLPPIDYKRAIPAGTK